MRTITVAVVMTVLSISIAMLDAQAAGMRLQRLPEGGGPIKPVQLPLALSKDSVNVIVQLAEDPVTVRQVKAGRKLSKTEKENIKSRLASTQSSLHQPIARLGGTVMSKYQVSYNGIKVNIPRHKVSALAALPGVVAVRALPKMKLDNTQSVALINTFLVWEELGTRGEGIKVAVIDTGIDYTHANFGGSGKPADYAAAHAAETLPPNPAWFGPNAPRVKGGVDLVGDAYNADKNTVPQPDPNPLDCQGHGSHVAGTLAGSGVTTKGTMYRGSYEEETIVANDWNVGPGVAPYADIYAVRVFGCDGTTDMTIDAIEWAVDNGMDVINMSLGSPFGVSDDPVAAAATNAARAGVIVVTSAGNEGASPYLTGSPGTADGAISVAANDPLQSFPGARFAMSATGAALTVMNANGAAFGNGIAYPVAVIRDAYPDGRVALGCSQSEYDAYVAANGPDSLAGRMIVTLRGTCSRVARAILAQMNAAAAALMINNAPGYPPFEGPITTSAETGPLNVTIPFFGAKGTDSSEIVANDNAAAAASSVVVANSNYTGFGTFSSSGPRNGDSFLKPDLTAPGVSIQSTLSGGGGTGTVLSGTSMASPHVAGVAALVRQLRPTWSVNDVKAAVVNTAVPSGVADYTTIRGGTGLVQPVFAGRTNVVAHDDGGSFAVALNFGFAELDGDYSMQKRITLRNNFSRVETFTVSQSLPAGSTHTVSFDPERITVPASGSAEVLVTLNVPFAGVGDATSFRDVSGVVLLKPLTSSDNVNVSLRVPYYLAARARSNVSTVIGELAGSDPTTIATVTNNGAAPGDADFYAWGLEGEPQPGSSPSDVRAIGVQSFVAAEAIGADAQADESLIVFAVNTRHRWSNASTVEFDIYVDVDGDGVDDYLVVGADNGALTSGEFDGRLSSAVFSLTSDKASSFFMATAPTDSSTALLPVLSRQLCMDEAHCLNSVAQPRFTYHAQTFDLSSGAEAVLPDTGRFNPWTNAISTGGFTSVGPGVSDGSLQIRVNSAEWAMTPAKGLMIVTLDNKAGSGQAQLIPVAATP